ncbi:O-fucosyltransferase family protein [Rhynchospora pubera]|uniref:O-fucosyltransferase family protein n=1 Tax=Rhynchospora pubera TaxID=906938 RepID=A0AAV8EWR9_9POAL|nr:O-fucosyltransferase family protein [Rhynchospora pubera]
MDWSGAGSGRRWRTRPPTPRSKPLIYLLISLPLSLLLLLYLSPFTSLSSPPPLPSTSLCSRLSLSDERFLWYAPHSGFTNQVGELKNALLIGAILNRTVIVPPALDHHAVALGSCPKFRVSSPATLRAAVWDHIMELVRDQRYVSMADIIDISSVTASMVRTIDFRVFASIWCGQDIKKACSSSMCCSLSTIKPVSDLSDQCRSLISGLDTIKGTGKCIYTVEEDCRTTVWTYQQNADEELDSFQPDESLKKKKNISYVRTRKDVYRSLGPGTVADRASVLAFGTVFSAPYKGSQLYIDIHASSADLKIKNLIKKIEFLPFASEIMRAGREFAIKRIKGPFLCAQLRLLDGQFKNHWKGTFSALKDKLKTLNQDSTISGTIDIFIMTDLPKENWTKTYLEEIDRDKKYKVYTLDERDDLVVGAAKGVRKAEMGIKSGFFPRNLDVQGAQESCELGSYLPDVLLFVEQSVCSCASLGFVGTAGSTIAESIELMRKNNVCDL